MHFEVNGGCSHHNKDKSGVLKPRLPIGFVNLQKTYPPHWVPVSTKRKQQTSANMNVSPELKFHSLVLVRMLFTMVLDCFPVILAFMTNC